MSDDRQESATSDGPDDRTRPLPPPAPAGPAGPGDTLRTASGGAGTGRTPSAPWSGRAEVPAPRSAGYPEPAAGEWYPEDQGDRRWWMPILVASVALVVLAVLGLGLWLIARAELEPEPTVPSSLPTATAPTTGPTTTAPTTAPTTGTPTTTGPVRVPMPPLVGLPQSAAESLLDRLGLGYRVELRRSDRPPGTVIETDPRAGETVVTGSDVTLVVAERGEAETRPPVVTPSATG